MRHYRPPKRDASEPAIIEALRAAGASVVQLEAGRGGTPDLAVGYRAKTFLLECKTPERPRVRKGQNKIGFVPEGKLREAQKRWHDAWTGDPVRVVTTPAEALAAIGAAPVVPVGIEVLDKLPPAANPWGPCPCGEYRFRLYSEDERIGKDGRFHSRLVCSRRPVGQLMAESAAVRETEDALGAAMLDDAHRDVPGPVKFTGLLAATHARLAAGATRYRPTSTRASPRSGASRGGSGET